MTYEDYYSGTAFIKLIECDFVSKERYMDFARFMKQSGKPHVIIPIDSDVAKLIEKDEPKKEYLRGVSYD